MLHNAVQAGTVTAQVHTSTELVRSGPEQPVLLQQMLAMARQQDALQEQSQHVQQLLQQMREEQTTLASRLEDIRKDKHERALGQGAHQAVPSGASAALGIGDSARRDDLGRSSPEQDAITKYTHVAQQDLRALQLLKNNGAHVTDDVFRGTPEQHYRTNASQTGITRAEAAVLHQSGGGPSLLPSLTMPAAVALDIEEADPQTVNSVIIQFLSVTPACCLNAPRKMKRCFMRFQFYDFRATETPVYTLNPVQHSSAAMVCSQSGHLCLTQWHS